MESLREDFFHFLFLRFSFLLKKLDWFRESVGVVDSGYELSNEFLSLSEVLSQSVSLGL